MGNPESEESENKVEHKAPNVEKSTGTAETQTSRFAFLYRAINRIQEKLRRTTESSSAEIAKSAEAVEQTAVIIHASDAAREVINEFFHPQTVGITTESAVVLSEKTPGKKLGETESILEKENPFEYMALIRVSNNPPVLENGRLVIRTALQETEGKVPRPTLHFTVNCRVGNNDGGTWDNVDFAYIIPADKAVEKNGKPYALGKEDTYWATVKGFELPEGTMVLYNKNKLSQPGFEKFLQECKNSQTGVNFVASEGEDQSQIDSSLAEMGYADIPKFVDNEESLAKKIGVKEGGYGTHTGSPIWVMEKTFIHGMPGFKAESRGRGNTAAHNPFDQFGSLYKLKDDLPEDVYRSFENLAFNNLKYLLADKVRIKDFARTRVEGPGGYDDEREFKKGIYRGIAEIASVSEKSLYLQEVVSGHPELKTSSLKVVLESAVDPDFFEIGFQIFSGDFKVSEDMKKQILNQAIESASYLGLVALEYFPSQVTPDQERVFKENLFKNKQNFAQTATPEQFAVFMGDLKKESKKYISLLGKETYDYFAKQ